MKNTFKTQKAFYLERMEQNRNGDENLNHYFDERFGKDSRLCRISGRKVRVDMFRSDEKEEIVFYLVGIKERMECASEDEFIDDDFGTFCIDDIYDPLSDVEGECGDEDYICVVTPIAMDEIKDFNRFLFANINESYNDLLVVGL